MEIGIVGLPNVGKSMLFNALLKKQQALAANYPFATIEPNIGVVGVPDERLEMLAAVVREAGKLNRLPPEVQATVRFVDIAGLVAGASKGEGLGNKFLSHIREVDAIAHVIRAFDDPNVIRAGSENPRADLVTVETELKLADLDVAGKLLDGIKKDKSNPDSELLTTLLQGMVSKLEAGQRAAEVEVPERLADWKRSLPLLTTKPAIYVLNVEESQLSSTATNGLTAEKASELGVSPESVVVVCAKVESELSELSASEQREYLNQLGQERSGLERLIQSAFSLLGLQTFLTAPSSAKASEGQGVFEVRAWTIKKDMKAPQAAGVIHTDFEKHFIKAEVVSFEDFISLGGWQKARELGRVRVEGREYVMREGDVVEFKVGV